MNIIELAKQYNLLEDIKDLKQVIFYRPKGLSPFQEFVLTNRLWHFIKLKILFDDLSGEEFVVGYGEIKYYEPHEDDDDPGLTQTFGPAVLKVQLAKQQVIDTELANLEFRAIIQDAPPLYLEKAYDQKGEVFSQVTIQANPMYKEGERNQEFYLSTQGDLLLAHDRMYCTEEVYDHFKDMVTYHNKEFEEFLRKHNDIGIPHEIYVEWLQKMFPGKISIRSLK